MTADTPVQALIRQALADLQPRIDIASRNATILGQQRQAEEENLMALLAQDRAYREALGETDDPASE